MESRNDPVHSDYKKQRRAHWNSVAAESDPSVGWGAYYHSRLARIYQHLVTPFQRVLEIGCAQGDLLAALQPSKGIGVDFSSGMLERARRRHPGLQFVLGDAQELPLSGTFDVIILSDLLNDLWDVQTVLKEIWTLSHTRTRLIINSYSRLWELPLAIVERLGMARPTLNQNWLTVPDVRGLLHLANFEVIRDWQEVLWPLRTPVLARFFNQYLVRMWPLNLGALTNFVIARPAGCESAGRRQYSVSVIIPARNEAGNMPNITERIPPLGCETELIFVEGHSRDDTYAAIERVIAEQPHYKCKLLRQTGTGKGDAVRLGFANAGGDVLMILDADLTMPPEDLPRYYEALQSGKAEFVNGVRLVYPMEKDAMRFANLVGNKLFGLAFSWLLGQPVKDTLCGTKALWRADYDLIARNRSYFGDFDPFGDFDLLFGAARLNLKIVDMPVRYRQRVYGTTNIQRWKHGVLLLRMLIFGARRMKFI